MKKLPQGELVIWITEQWSGINSEVKAQLGKNNIALTYPPQVMLNEIINYCDQSGVKLGGLSFLK